MYLINLICSDLFRYTGHNTFQLFLQYLLLNPGFRYTFLFRLTQYLRARKILFPLYVLTLVFYRHYTYRFGILLHYRADIGEGLYIGHFGGIIVSEKAKIGRNCNLSHGVTIGQANRGKREGFPTIGDRVYIGPGAKIIGRVYVGNDVAIGANAVVVDDVPANAVVAGIPAEVISMNGSKGYVNRTWK